MYRYDPVIYPVRVWGCITDDADDLSDRFVYSPSGDSFCRDEGADKLLGYVSSVQDIKSGDIGFLVVYKNRKVMNIELMAHEATHVARKIWEYLGEDTTGREADAYLVGWIASCLEDMKNRKEK